MDDHLIWRRPASQLSWRSLSRRAGCGWYQAGDLDARFFGRIAQEVGAGILLKHARIGYIGTYR